MRPALLRATVSLTCLVAWPMVALAQSTIAGSVRDVSGGVLPGVTVEAASVVLIEKARTGFTTFRRESLAVPAEFTATVNAGTGSIKYTSVLTNRLLLEGGYSLNREYRNVAAQEGIAKGRGTPEWFASGSDWRGGPRATTRRRRCRTRPARTTSRPASSTSGAASTTSLTPTPT